MAALGLGIALGTWLSIPACLVPPLIGFALRAARARQPSRAHDAGSRSDPAR